MKKKERKENGNFESESNGKSKIHRFQYSFTTKVDSPTPNTCIHILLVFTTEDDGEKKWKQNVFANVFHPLVRRKTNWHQFSLFSWRGVE